MLKGKKILIAGASRGIGSALAKDLAAQGAELAIGARNLTSLRALADRHPQILHHQKVDFSDPDDCRMWCEGALRALGGISGLIVTATAGRSRSAIEDMDQSYQIDFRAPVVLFRACQTALAQSGGSVILFSSRSVRQPDPNTLAYAGAKAALEFATRSLALEGHAQGIRVNALALGSILTPDGFWHAQRASDTPLWHRVAADIGTIDHVTGPVRFLLSQAACWITGQIILVDGGQTLRHFHS